MHISHGAIMLLVVGFGATSCAWIIQRPIADAGHLKGQARHGLDLPDHCVCLQVDGVQVEMALQWCSDIYSDSLLGFVNSIKTIDGGTHMDGLNAALTRLVNTLARKIKTLKEGDSNLSGDHVREGLAAIVSVKVATLHAIVTLVPNGGSARQQYCCRDIADHALLLCAGA